MNLLEKIVNSHNKGSRIGYRWETKQASQLFGLYYLDSVDRLIKEKLRIKHYTKQSLAASMGYLKQGHTYGLRKQALKDFALKRKEEEL